MVRHNIAGNFFEALGDGGREGAFQYLNRTSFVGDVGADGVRAPSPRAQALINSGEWDSNRQLQLYRVEDDACWGLLPTFAVVENGPGYTRFCPERGCNVNSHARQKVPVGRRLPGWYLQAGGSVNKGACLDFRFPLAPDGPVCERAVPRLVGPDAMKMTHGQWRFLFDEFKAYHNEGTDPDESPQVRPHEPEGGGPIVEDASLSQESAVSEAKEQDPIDLFDETLDELQETARQAELRVDTVFDSADTVNSAEDLEERFGVRIADMFNDRDTRLCAQFAEAIGRTIDEVRASYKRDRARLASQAQASLKRHKEALDTELKEVLDGVAKHQQELTEQNVKLAALNDKLLRDRDQLRRELAGVSNLQVTVSALTAKLDAMDPVDSTRRGLTEHELGEWSTIRFEVLDERGALSTLQSLVKTMREKEAAGGDVTCHGMTFASDHQLNTWFYDKKLRIDCFHDARSLANCITETVVSKDKSTKSVEAREKARITSDLHAGLISSFEGILPPLLGGGGSEADAGGFDCLKSTMKTFEKWDPSGTRGGIRGRLLAGVDAVVSRIEITQRQAGLSGDARELAAGLRVDSVAFLYDLANWKSTGFRELAEDTGIDRSTLWDMFMECEDRIWQEIAEARGPYADAGHVSEGYWLFGMIKAWEIQERYRRNHIHDDPALTGIFTRQLLFHGQDVSLRSKLDRISDQVTKAETTAKTAAGEVRSAATKIKSLETDMKRIKDKGLI